MRRLLILTALGIATSISVFGQYTYSGTTLSYDAENVYASTYVETDYYTAQYYSLYLVGFLYDCDQCYSGNSVVAWGDATGTGYASWSGSAPVSANWYTVWADPYLVSYYEVEIDYAYYYEDPYGYSLESGDDDGDPAIYEYAPGEYEYSEVQYMPVDGAYQAVLANGPPAYMQVINDYQGLCGGCTTTVERVTTYQVMQANGSNVGYIAICEVVTTPNWTCTQTKPTPDTLACGTPPGGTTSSGQFTDTWSLFSQSYSPAGCGYTNETDEWEEANLNGTFTPFGKLSGSLLTNSTTINGYTIVGVSGTGMPMYFRINP